ncbi:hypothetical protein XENOCAPTIV_030475 [Xenoophorus captivus]|uniref:Secreted protein n=1 Tax=Xenoophorus captivus TaxID=1517983 RepID=A0ABV0RCN5_9TELE
MSSCLISLIVHSASAKCSLQVCACVSVDRFHRSIPQPICLAGLFTVLHLRQGEPSLQESSLNLSSLCPLLLFCFSTGLGKVNEKIRSADTPTSLLHIPLFQLLSSSNVSVDSCTYLLLLPDQVKG